MPITREEVRHIALLARLELSEAEEAAMAEQLDHILAYFERLRELDTEAVPPTTHVRPFPPRYRQDEVTCPQDPDRWLQNAPARDGRFFKVPKIIE